jgi:hypothetical protein
MVEVVENIDTEAFALGSYCFQVVCTFQFIHPLSADYFLLKGWPAQLQSVQHLICGNDGLPKPRLSLTPVYSHY